MLNSYPCKDYKLISRNLQKWSSFNLSVSVTEEIVILNEILIFILMSFKFLITNFLWNTIVYSSTDKELPLVTAFKISIV